MSVVLTSCGTVVPLTVVPVRTCNRRAGRDRGALPAAAALRATNSYKVGAHCWEHKVQTSVRTVV